MNNSKEWDKFSIPELEKKGLIKLGRGNIISKNDIRDNPGGYPIYSSSAKGDGLFGKYGNYMFNEEMITWSIDGGGSLFYRPRHKFSITNVSGYMILDKAIFDYRFVHAALSLQHSFLTFDYQTKAHPSVIRDFYTIPVPPLAEQKKIAYIISLIDKKISLSKQKVQKKGYLLKAIFNSESLKKDCKSFVPLSEIGVWRGGGTPSKSILEYWKGSIPWVSPKDMTGNRIYDTQDHITSQAIENSSALLIKKGSILFVVRSGILRNKLPIAFAEKDLTINQDLKSLQINSQWDKDFIFYFLKSNSDKIRTSCMKVGTTVESIASDLLMEYMIPSVSKLIQENLGKVARRIDQSMEFENYSIDSIIRLKNALLQDLLSGSKRVSV